MKLASCDPELIRTLSAVFDLVWKRLWAGGDPSLSPRIAEIARKRVTRTLLRAAEAGERDLDRLADAAMADLHDIA